MLRNPFLTIMLCLCSFVWVQSFAVGPDEGKQEPAAHKRWKPGFIVTVKGDTIPGLIKVPNFLDVNYDYQRLVIVQNSKGFTTEYGPYNLKSFYYYNDGDSANSLITMQSVSSPDGDGHVFLRLYFTGVCKVYGFVKTEAPPSSGFGPGPEMTRSSLIPSEKKFIQLRGDQFYPLRGIRFKQSMINLFSECPLIQSKLESKEYTYDTWQAMVKDYNNGICK